MHGTTDGSTQQTYRTSVGSPILVAYSRSHYHFAHHAIRAQSKTAIPALQPDHTHLFLLPNDEYAVTFTWPRDAVFSAQRGYAC